MRAAACSSTLILASSELTRPPRGPGCLPEERRPAGAGRSAGHRRRGLTARGASGRMQQRDPVGRFARHRPDVHVQRRQDQRQRSQEREHAERDHRSVWSAPASLRLGSSWCRAFKIAPLAQRRGRLRLAAQARLVSTASQPAVNIHSEECVVFTGSEMMMVMTATSGSSQMSPGRSRRCETPRRQRPASSQATAASATNACGCSTQAIR